MGAKKEDGLKFFASYIEGELGIVYSEQNYYQLEKRLNDICRMLDVPDQETLYDKAKGDGISGDFKSLLLDIATNNETSFFRDPKIFNTIINFIVKDWREENPNAKVFNVWSAACSFGQEPYSLLMAFEEEREKDPTFPRLNMLATDVSDAALKKAKSGIYSQLEVQRGLPAPLMIKYFDQVEDGKWRFKSSLSSQVAYKKVNLLELFGLSGPFDLVLCRNVLIYQNSERKKEILKNISTKLKAGGGLVLGSAESLLGLSDDYEQFISGGAVHYKKKE